jgi:hypothetical protein
MNLFRKTTLFIAITASAALSSAAMAQDDRPSAWSFGGRNSPFISPSDAGFPRPLAAQNGNGRKNLERAFARTPSAYY